MKKLSMLLCLLLSCGLLAAGCGDDDDGDSGDKGGDTATQTEATQDTGSATPDVSSEPAVKQAVESCKQSVQSTPQLSESAKGDLVDICEKSASGDEDAVREATRDVCIKIIDETVPVDGPAKDQAKEACEAGTK